MSTSRFILPKLHPAQVQIALNDSRFKVIAAGRRFGKGVLTIGEMFVRASRGQKCRWISPSYASDSFQAGWNMASYLQQKIPGVERRQMRKEFSFPRFPGGGWIQFRTAEEPDGLRGEGLDFVNFDEAAHVKGLEDIWDLCVRPSLMDRQGHAWFISTPKGHNYFSTLFKRGRDGEKDWASFQFATGDNPHIAKDEIKSMRRGMPLLVARQEVDAEFVALAGALFRRENITVLEKEPFCRRWVRTWDLAFTEKTNSDYTSGAKVGMTDDGTVVLSHIVHDRLEWPEAVRLIGDTARMDGVTIEQGIEVVGAQVGMLQTILRDPLLSRFVFRPIQVHKDKLTRALPLVARSEQGKFAIVRGPWNQKFIDEACAFPEGMHDDMVDSTVAGMEMLANGITGKFVRTDGRREIIMAARRMTSVE